MSLPLLTKLATGLLLWVSLNTVSFAVEPCGRCDESACDTSPKLCPSGMVRDRCDCCQVCGLNDGEECDVDVVNDQRGYFARKRYSPVHGRCGNHLKCIVQEPNEEVKRVTDSAKCVCEDSRHVCGGDGKTYRNPCYFDEVMAGRRERIPIVRYEPCDEAPKIVSSPENIKTTLGESLILSCEAAGYPTPKIEWLFTKEDGTSYIMPSDDLKKSVQARGGPENYEISAWVQIEKMSPEDVGTYTCIAKNKLGKSTASCTVVIQSDKRDL